MSNFEAFKKECESFLFDVENQVQVKRYFDSYFLRFAYGTDASCYRYIPKLVLKPTSEEEVTKIIKLSHKYDIPLTFKGSGTSLSGQACSDSVLVITNFRWQKIQITDNNESIWLDCGVIGCEANDALKRLNKKIGPDPATINNASIGGIFSNNSSGMCCGVKQNSYQTVKAIRVILPDGTLVDTSDDESFNAFLEKRSDIAKGLLSIREKILADESLKSLIERKYKIKNTTGYGINSFVDFSDVKDIFNHIFIGAEGTLGFVSRVKYQTVEDFKYTACTLLFYKDNATAAEAVKVLAKNDDIVSAGEFMDYYCLKAAQGLSGMPEVVNQIEDGNCCILVQLQDNDEAKLDEKIATLSKELSSVENLFGMHFSRDADEIASWWKIRKSILPLAASTREPGSTCITEDICFEIPTFGQGIDGIVKLFKKYHLYGVIYGHVLAGNVHFNISPKLSDPVQRENFAKFMDDLVDHVVSLHGSTKAEHGTGRMMAPFVETEWGEKAYEIHKAVKNLFDAKNNINPDVMICEDKGIHLKNLKPANAIEDFLTNCMECGFCEKVCPSKHLTLTPRQRIAIYREISRLKSLNNRSEEESKELSELENGFKYYGVKTCAMCSMCKTVCPLEIDTAKLTIKKSNEDQSTLGVKVASMIANRMATTVKLGKIGLRIANLGQTVLGLNNVRNLSIFMHNKMKSPIVPRYMPTANKYELENKQNGGTESVVYFSSCMNRGFAPAKMARDRRPIQQVFESVCKKAHVDVLYPKGLNGMCCGKAFKEYAKRSDKINPLEKTLELLMTESKDGSLPIIMDHSACSQELLDKLKEHPNFAKLKIYDMIEYVDDVLLDKLSIKKINENVGIYSVCALKHHNKQHILRNIAHRCTESKVFEDLNTFCCGFAGNKGFTTPELNHRATEHIHDYFDGKCVDRCYASSSSCEVGLSDRTDRSWQHIIYLVDEVSSELPSPATKAASADAAQATDAAAPAADAPKA